MLPAVQSSNVLIDQYGQAHVADFGLARHIGGARAAVGHTITQHTFVNFPRSQLALQQRPPLCLVLEHCLPSLAEPGVSLHDPERLPGDSVSAVLLTLALAGRCVQVSGPGPYAHMSDVTTVTSIRGTYGYLSPEYLEQGQASVRADVFAYGVVLLEIMTGACGLDRRALQALCC